MGGDDRPEYQMEPAALVPKYLPPR